MEAKSDNNCVLLFVKYPSPGRVKTRLTKSIGDKDAAWLYRCFVEDMLEMLTETGSDVWICFDPAEKKEKSTEWIGTGYKFLPQRGDNLGERMKNAFNDAFAENIKQAILIGSDIPDLPSEIIESAFNNLSKSGVVIGPSRDGGYYLIGFSSHTFTPEVFDDIPWSTSMVLDRTMDKMGKNKPAILTQFTDIDTVEDLATLAINHIRTGFRSFRTIEFIQQLGILNYKRSTLEDSKNARL